MASHNSFNSIARQTQTLTISPIQFYALLSNEADSNTKLNMLDVILLEDSNGEKRPYIWLYTDTSGSLTKKMLNTMVIADLVKSILNNIESNEGTLGHSDIFVNRC